MNASLRFRDADEATFRTALAEALQETGPLARRRKFSAAISALRAEEMREALSMIRRLDRQVANNLVRQIFTRWAEINPAQAAQYATASIYEDWSWHALRATMDVWSANAPERAVEWIVTLRDQDVISSSLRAFLFAVAESDPQRALRLKRDLASDSRLARLPRAEFGWFDHNIFAAWGRRSGSEAAKAALTLPEPSERRSAIRGALNGWASRDLQAALRFAGTVRQPLSPIDAVEAIIIGQPNIDPEELAAGILELPAGPVRTAALSKAMERIAESDPALAQRLIAEVPPSAAANQMHSIVAGALAARDPQAAAAFLAGVPRGRCRDEDFLKVGRSWARSDLDAALQWAANVPVEKLQQSAVSGALETWADTEPSSAATWAITHLSEEKAADMLSSICGEWSRSDLTGALDWALALPDGKSRSASLQRLLGPLAANEPARAMQLFSELPEDSQSTAASEIAEQWARKDPTSAAHWTLRLADESVRDNALGTVMQQWIAEDISSAENWVRALPAGAARDAAATRFIDDAYNSDPARAAGLLPMIADLEQREDAASSLLSEWRRSDKAAARAWIQTTPALAPDARKRLLLDFE
jgi:hypothetical protein